MILSSCVSDIMGEDELRFALRIMNLIFNVLFIDSTWSTRKHGHANHIGTIFTDIYLTYLFDIR